MGARRCSRCCAFAAALAGAAAAGYGYAYQNPAGSIAAGLAVWRADAHAARVVDHANADRYTMRDAARVAKLRVFFAHASVGWNILNGMNALHQHDPRLYPLRIDAAAERPPASTAPGTMYQMDRGNPGWDAKVDLFERYCAQGWHAPAADVMVNKFCFIDQDAHVDKYVSSMQKLEASHPDTVFVYTTIPLTTAEDDANIQRDAFNAKLRVWCRSRGKALLDIADIEDHAPGGKARFFAKNGQFWEKQYEGYSADGGHLNDSGSVRVAQGFYTLLAQVAH